jgi:hypothetical protein
LEGCKETEVIETRFFQLAASAKRKKFMVRKEMKTLLFLLLLALVGVFLAKPLFFARHRTTGTVYYITPATDLRTVSAMPLKAGDSLLFQRGGVWKGVLNIKQSGTAASPIYIGAYGKGPLPVLTTRTAFPGWKVAANWRKINATTWAYNYISPTNKSYRIWLDGVEGQRAKDSTAISNRRRFSYLSDYMILYVYATANPATFYKSIEYPSDETGTINLYGVNNIVLENLDVRGSSGGTIDLSTVNGIKIRNCTVGIDAGHVGIRSFYRADNVEITNCEITSGDKVQDYFLYQNGLQDGIALNTGCHNWLIDGNYIHDWGHSDIEFTDIADRKNDTVPLAASLAGGYTMSNILIQRNLCKAANVEYCRGIGLDSRRWHKTDNIAVRYNWFDSLPVRNQLECNGAEFSYNIVSNIRNSPLPELGYGVGQGIMITPYSYTGAQNMKIVGNTIVNCDEAGITISSAADERYSVVKDNLIANNILAGNGRVGMNGMQHVQLAIEPNSGNKIRGNSYKNNLLFSNATGNVFHDIRVSGTAAYKTASLLNTYNGNGHGDLVEGNVYSDPQLAANYSLQPTSPALGTGVNLGAAFNKALAPSSTWPKGVKTVPQPAHWSIGAFAVPGKP